MCSSDLTLYLLIPWTAINLTDFYVIRHGNYDIAELFKVNGKYGKVNWFALIVYGLTVLVEWPFMNNAWIVGFVFAAIVYYVGARYFMSPAGRSKRATEVLTGQSV